MPNVEALDHMIEKAGAFHKSTMQQSKGRNVGKAELLMTTTTPYSTANSSKPALEMRKQQLKIERYAVLQQFATNGFFAGNEFCTWSCARQYIEEHAPPQLKAELVLLVELVAAGGLLS